MIVGGKNLLVIGTTSDLGFLESLGICDAFSVTYHVPVLKADDARKVLQKMNVFHEHDLDAAAEALDNMPLKKLYMLVEMAAQGETGGSSEAIYSGQERINIAHFFDCLIVYELGLANPAPLASVLWLDDQLESAVKLDSIITVVDAKNLRQQIDEYCRSSSFSEAYVQIAYADVIILNKVDLVSPDATSPAVHHLEELEKEIHNINSLATIIHSVRCQVDLCRILECHAYDAEHVARLEALLGERNLASSMIHDSGVRTLCICEHQQVDLNKVSSWLEEILWEKKTDMDVYRCKGILNIHGTDQLHTLQAVRGLYEIVPLREWRPEEKRMSKIVFIGHNLDEDSLRLSLGACTTKDQP